MENPMVKKNNHGFAVACQAEKTLERVGKKFKHTNLLMTSHSLQGSTEKRKRSEEAKHGCPTFSDGPKQWVQH